MQSLKSKQTGALGLYYKLHGVHRPVVMKKETIKRRKRVVPAALQDQSPENLQVPTHAPAPPPHPVDSSESVPLSNIDTNRGSINSHPEGPVDNASREQRGHPPLVDFTGYRHSSTKCGRGVGEQRGNLVSTDGAPAPSPSRESVARYGYLSVSTSGGHPAYRHSVPHTGEREPREASGEEAEYATNSERLPSIISILNPQPAPPPLPHPSISSSSSSSSVVATPHDSFGLHDRIEPSFLSVTRDHASSCYSSPLSTSKSPASSSSSWPGSTGNMSPRAHGLGAVAAAAAAAAAAGGAGGGAGAGAGDATPHRRPPSTNLERRRNELEKEAELMRKILAAKERELAELEIMEEAL